MSIKSPEKASRLRDSIRVSGEAKALCRQMSEDVAQIDIKTARSGQRHIETTQMRELENDGIRRKQQI